MIVPTSFQNQTVVVLGLGRSGLSAARALRQAGAHVLVWDDQAESREKASQDDLPLLDPASFSWTKGTALILSPGIPHTHPTPHPLVLSAQKAGISPLSDIELLSLTHPHARYIGVTGTNGKSSTTALLGHCLQAHTLSTEIGGNIGTPVCELAPLEKDGIYVLELSSYQLEISPHFHPTIGILLNITPDHLERHGGWEGYIAAKMLMFQNTTPHDTAIINVDDAPCAALHDVLKSREQGPHLVPFSVQRLLPDGISVLEGMLYEKGERLADVTPFKALQGEHNWQNIAAAYGAIRTLGLPPASTLKAFASFPGLAHRQQIVAQCEHVTFVNDSKATNAEATEKALRTYHGRPLYCLLGGRAKEGGLISLTPYFPLISHAFLFGEAAPEFAKTLEGHVPFTLCTTLEEATEAATHLALETASPEAVVLLSPACASFDQFRNFEERGDAFCHYVENIAARPQKNFTSLQKSLK